MKQALGTIIGVVVGALGAIMFSGSLAPEEGSVEEQLEVTREKLRKTERVVRQYEEKFGSPRNRRTVKQGVQDIARALKEGREVSMDEVFRVFQGPLQDVSPILDRLRQVEEEDWADQRAGAWGRKYNLTQGEREQLKDWFMDQSRERAEEWTRVVHDETSGFVDFVKASDDDWRHADGVDQVMERMLEGEELEQFRAERLQERVDSVQGAANRQLNRLNDIVELDDSQQDDVFGILARGSEDYQVGMDFDGMGGDTSVLDVRQRDEAIRSVLRPDQRERFDQLQAERREEAERELKRVGLTLPKDWDLLERNTF
jgi:Spy/CpxP family protein refolding chaperone